jgi:hypothetical protein
MPKVTIFLSFMYLVSATIASQTSQGQQSEQHAWLTQPSDAFDRADVEDYRALNGFITNLPSEANLDHGTAYLIPKPEGPTLLVLSNDSEPITRPFMEKIFELLNRELERRLKARTTPSKAISQIPQVLKNPNATEAHPAVAK